MEYYRDHLYIAVTHDARNNLVYWTDQNGGSRTIVRKNFNSQADEDIETVADTGIYNPSGIAFDWITGNIYLVDSNRSHIVVCRSEIGDCAVVVQGHKQKNSPRIIALHPNQRIMFWTGSISTPCITRAGMDGSLVQVIVSTDIMWPQGLAVDQGSSRIFWAETIVGRIESSRFDGSDRRIANFGAPYHPGPISMFGDRIFWSDEISPKLDIVLSADKYNGSNRQEHVFLFGENLYDLDLFHITNQPIRLSNPCVRADNCSHICALSQADTEFRCFCPIGIMLQDDNMTCVEQRHLPKLVVAFKGTIKLMKFNTIGRTKLESITFPNINAISAIVYNPINHTLIFSDSASKRIYEYGISTKEINVLIDRHLDSVIGMDIDVVGENLYWIDTGKQTIEAMAFRTMTRSVIKTGVEQAIDILIVPKTGLLLVARTGRRGGSIDKMYLSGNGMTIIQTFEDKQPIALTYDEESGNILWVDRMSLNVYTISIDGNSSFTLVLSHDGQLSDVAKFGHQVFWVDSFSQKIKFKLVDSNKNYSITIHSLEGESHFSVTPSFQAKLTIINSNLSGFQELLSRHECTWMNPARKACSYMCLLTRDELVCVFRCSEGFTLEEDGLTCKQKLTCDRNQFSCKDGQCISRNSVCNGVSDCRRGEDEVQCDTSPCPEGRFKCPTDGVCIPQDWVCDKDEDCEGGADELNCHIRSCHPGLEFKCKNSDRYIYNFQRCNGQFDCPNQSDELNCNNTCAPGFFKCITLFECIDEDWTCDGDKDCDDGSDEMDCGICSPHQFRCNNGWCIARDFKCDGFSHCPGNEDEINCESTQNEGTTITTEKYVKKYDISVTTDENVHSHDVDIVDTTVVAPTNENTSTSGDDDGGNWHTYILVIGLIAIIIIVSLVIALVLSNMKRGEVTMEQVQFPL